MTWDQANDCCAENGFTVTVTVSVKNLFCNINGRDLMDGQWICEY